MLLQQFLLLWYTAVDLGVKAAPRLGSCSGWVGTRQVQLALVVNNGGAVSRLAADASLA